MNRKSLPEFIPSNMTDEEFLNMIDEACPAYVTERFKEMLGMREELEAVDTEAESERDALRGRVTAIEGKVDTLRERWDTLRDKFEPKSEPEEFALLESTIETIEEWVGA